MKTEVENMAKNVIAGMKTVGKAISVGKGEGRSVDFATPKSSSKGYASFYAYDQDES